MSKFNYAWVLSKRVLIVKNYEKKRIQKFQMLAGNTLMSRYHADFEIESPLIVLLYCYVIGPLHPLKCTAALKFFGWVRKDQCHVRSI